jgi:NHLM bacteriocin system ABC transporter peptidase/ATP-binding protein
METLRVRRRKTPTVIQMEATECGAASLAIILGYHGKHVPLAELRQACGVTRDGSKASNILRVARSYGCVAKGYKKELPKLFQARMPVIVFWNFKHFLVVEGCDRHFVYLNDPGTGPRKVSHQEFDRGFSGVVLEIHPGPEFQPSGKRPDVTASLARRLGNFKGLLRKVILISLFTVVPGIAVPMMIRYFVDSIMAGPGGFLWAVILGMGAAVAARYLLVLAQQRSLIELETRLATSSSSELFNHLLRLPLVFFDHRHSSEVGTRVKLNDSLAQLLSTEVATNSLNGLMVVFLGIVMWVYDPLLTLLTALITLLNLAAVHYVARKRSDDAARLLQEQGKWMSVTMMGIRMMETHKASGSEPDFFAQWSGCQARVLNVQQQLGFSTQLLSALPVLLSWLNQAAVLLIGGARVMEGSMTLGSLIAFQTLLFSFSEPILRLVILGSQLQTIGSSITRLDDVLQHPADPLTVPSRFAASADLRRRGAKLSGRIEVRNLSFGYSRMDPPLLQDFSLVADPGQRIAIIGPTGSGKSTLAKLLTGLYLPWQGEILFDGHPLSAIPRSVMMQSLALVDQEVFLFEGTVRDNLTLWDPVVPEASILQASKDACIHDEIATRGGGYYGKVEEAGRNFSGGQRQRLEIARALVTNPSILVLDEATSALDPVTEFLIDSNLRRRGCTCIIVAHRLSTIRDCDCILVLDRGRVVQCGRHDDLIRQPGLYASLLKDTLAEEAPIGSPA